MSRNQQSGYIVLITVLILGAMAAVVVGFLLLTGQNASLAGSSIAANAKDKAAATACAELALGAIAANNNLATPATATQTVDSTTGQACSYTIAGTSPNFTVSTTGTVTQGKRSFVHRLTITTSQVSPTITTSNWQDTP